MSAPNGTPINPKADNTPRSFGAAQLAFVLLIVEKIGPSEIPKSTRSKPKPASAEPQIQLYRAHPQMPWQFQRLTMLLLLKSIQILVLFICCNST